MIMKKTDFNRLNAYSAKVADGLEHDEAQSISKSATRIHKAEKQRDWLKAQEAELALLVSDTNDRLLDTFEATNSVFDAAKASKIKTKADLHQVFTLPREDYAMAA